MLLSAAGTGHPATTPRANGPLPPTPSKILFSLAWPTCAKPHSDTFLKRENRWQSTWLFHGNLETMEINLMPCQHGVWLSSFQHRAVNHLLNGCRKHNRSPRRNYFSFIVPAHSRYNVAANAFSRCKKHLKIDVIFFQEIRLRARLLCLFGVWLIL